MGGGRGIGLGGEPPTAGFCFFVGVNVTTVDLVRMRLTELNTARAALMASKIACNCAAFPSRAVSKATSKERSVLAAYSCSSTVVIVSQSFRS
jgi:hypothetical protein